LLQQAYRDREVAGGFHTFEGDMVISPSDTKARIFLAKIGFYLHKRG
jgi:hypothetical protein